MISCYAAGYVQLNYEMLVILQDLVDYQRIYLGYAVFMQVMQVFTWV